MKDKPTKSVDLAQLARQAMVERGLEPEFPQDALAQATQIRGPAQETQIDDRRRLPWCSIDNDDSRDLDQLTVAERLDGNTVRVHIAIADVDVLVHKGTPLDEHACRNTTSVYTPTRIFPMLPERLSTDLTSLNPHEDRVAVVISYSVGSDGRVGESDVRRALVRNQAKLAYNSVAKWLENSGPMPEPVAAVAGLADQLLLQNAVASQLQYLRHEQGALDLETIEPRAVLDEGHIVNLQREKKNRARALIEDFMIAANGVTSRFLESKGLPSIRRVVHSPERWDRLEILARQRGDQLPSDPDPKALADFLSRQRQLDPLHFPDLSLSVVKLLGKGQYVLTRANDDQGGHFGLAVRDYIHSTAPNRRYPDLITQRLLKAAIEGWPSPYASAELERLAEHCTKQEDAAEKVERQMRKSAAALFLSSRVGERFDGVITGASAKGTWVRIFDPPAEGRVIEGTAGLDVGDRVSVQLVRTDIERGFIDFST